MYLLFQSSQVLYFTESNLSELWMPFKFILKWGTWISKPAIYVFVFVIFVECYRSLWESNKLFLLFIINTWYIMYIIVINI